MGSGQWAVVDGEWSIVNRPEFLRFLRREVTVVVLMFIASRALRVLLGHHLHRTVVFPSQPGGINIQRSLRNSKRNSHRGFWR